MNDAVEHPSHYCSHKSGVECIEISEHMNFCLGNAMKYVWRAGLKEDGDEIQDLKKAIWYINREISRREHEITKKCLDKQETIHFQDGKVQIVLRTDTLPGEGNPLVHIGQELRKNAKRKKDGRNAGARVDARNTV